MTFEQLVAELQATLTSPSSSHHHNGGVGAMTERQHGHGGMGIEARIERVRTIFKQLKQHFQQAEDGQGKRQTTNIQILHNACTIHAHLALLLRHRCDVASISCDSHQLAALTERTLKALKQTTSLSHDQFVGPVKALENRKVQISLCLVESLADFLVADIDTFGLNIDAYEKCGRMRREIANALMNLIFQQRDAKLRLCSNLAFLRRVADLIEQIQELDQYYAGLIQNVSYNPDKKPALPFAHHLAITVPPLVRVVTRIMQEGAQISALAPAQKQRLYKILSALWNLAEDPIENKRVMCHDFPAFVPALLQIMLSDAREVPLIQTATGILKHLSAFILQYPELLAKTLGAGAVRALLAQLYSSSADLIVDALVALSLFCRHPYAVSELLEQQNAYQNIQFLTRNTNSGMVRAAKGLLDAVNAVYYQLQQQQQNGGGMFGSMVGGWNSNAFDQSQIYHAGDGGFSRQYYTLPRSSAQQQQQHHHFASHTTEQRHKTTTKYHHPAHPQETPKGVLKQQQQHLFLFAAAEAGVSGTGSMQEEVVGERSGEELVRAASSSCATTDIAADGFVEGEREQEQQQQHFDGGECGDDDDEFVAEPCIEAGQHLATSVQCTRAASPASWRADSMMVDDDDVKNGEEWPSSIRSTSLNSRRTSGAVSSAASPSELPDSPSQCASHKPFQLEAMALLIKKVLNEDEEVEVEEQIAATSTTPNDDDDGGGGEEKSPRNGENSTTNNSSEHTLGAADGRGGGGGRATAMGESAAVCCNNNLLDEAIRSYMPKPSLSSASSHFCQADSSSTNNNNLCKSPTKNNEKRKTGGKPKRSQLEHHHQLLEESIAAVMPPPPPNPPPATTSPKKRITSDPFSDPFFVSSTPPPINKPSSSGGFVRNFVVEQQNTTTTADLPADVRAEFGAHLLVLDCERVTITKTTTTSPKKCVVERNRNSSSGQSSPLKKCNSQSAIPRPSPRKGGGGGSNCSKSSSSAAQQQNQQKRTKHPPPPPLAPKPNIAKLAKNDAQRLNEFF